ncbi:MAG TPA: TrmH family RNA methyltransferase [Terricaulis sp.]|nr:TrmH family RNA methyltransferase [Terricaulis sp.]
MSARAPKPVGGLLLYDLQSPINIGMILRLAETFSMAVHVYDPRGVLKQVEKAKTISDFACGALQRAGYAEIEDPHALLGKRGRRVFATSIEDDAIPLSAHASARGDIYVVGNEYDGLPDDFLALAHGAVRVEMADVWTPKPASNTPIDPTRTAPVARDGKPNLNVAIAAGIVSHAHFMAMRARSKR